MLAKLQVFFDCYSYIKGLCIYLSMFLLKQIYTSNGFKHFTVNYGIVDAKRFDYAVLHVLVAKKVSEPCRVSP